MLRNNWISDFWVELLFLIKCLDSFTEHFVFDESIWEVQIPEKKSILDRGPGGSVFHVLQEQQGSQWDRISEMIRFSG